MVAVFLLQAQGALMNSSISLGRLYTLDAKGFFFLNFLIPLRERYQTLSGVISSQMLCRERTSGARVGFANLSSWHSSCLSALAESTYSVTLRDS